MYRKEVNILFSNLEKLLDSKSMSTKDYSVFLGIAEKTAYNKINGKTEFTLGEINKTSYLFPEYKIDYFFAQSDNNPKVS